MKTLMALDENILILCADTTMFLNKVDYLEKMKQLLAHSDTYTKLNKHDKDPTKWVKKLIDIRKREYLGTFIPSYIQAICGTNPHPEGNQPDDRELR